MLYGETKIEYHRQYYLRNKAKINASCKEYREKNKEILSQKSKNKYDPILQKEKTLKKAYGLTLNDFNAMLVSQSNKCPICKVELTKQCGRFKRRKTDANIDHNHDTGKVRSVLCQRCNVVLGAVNEDEDILTNMIGYIKKWED